VGSEQALLTAAGLAAGWLAGFAFAWFSELLTLTPAMNRRRDRWLLRDPLVQVPAAVACAGAAFLWPDWRAIAAGGIAVSLIQIAVTDYRTRYVYGVMAGIGLAIGLAGGWHVHGTPWWTGPVGALGAALVFGLLWGLGRLIFRTEAMARGDITIAAVIGAGAGICTPQALVWGVVIGGLVAVGILLARRTNGVFMPYGPGLCLGGLIALFWC
jgi:prepilin signal peptidase PulO-like enzyme (type II secretory pathway)